MTTVKVSAVDRGAESDATSPFFAMTVTAPLQDHHHHCDSLFALAERTAAAGAWESCTATFAEFSTQMELHFRTEEDVLFPAYEAATGSPEGPTRVMRVEHGQMRGLLQRMATELLERDADGFGGDAEALLILMQQHNMKEECMLYPLCDRSLDAQLGESLAMHLEAA